MKTPSASNLLRLANISMLVTAFVTLTAISLVYGIEDKLTLVQQIAGHITIMIMPALFKLSYVLRLVSLKALGLEE
ncbi:hypothetical protein [Thalassotalea agariperforans]